jgi:DNA-binding NarL/FixJ family response regulator
MPISCCEQHFDPSGAGVDTQEGNTAPSDLLLRTLVVQGDSHLRAVIDWLVQEDPRFVLAGSVGTGDQAIAWADPLEVALVDLVVPGVNALMVVRTLRTNHPGITVIVLADVDVPYLRAAAADAGAAGYLNRAEAGPGLGELILGLRSAASVR